MEGGKSLLKMLGGKSFWGGIENFKFCLGELTLDDTIGPNSYIKESYVGLNQISLLSLTSVGKEHFNSFVLQKIPPGENSSDVEKKTFDVQTVVVVKHLEEGKTRLVSE